jgi:hypothetical protein
MFLNYQGYSLEENACLWGGPPGPRPTPSSALVLIALPKPDQGSDADEASAPQNTCSALQILDARATVQ